MLGATSSETSASEPVTRQIQLELTASAAKDLRTIGNKKHLGQIGRKIDALEQVPLPHDARPIEGQAYKSNGWNFYRMDVGEYRIIYDLDEASGVLTIITIAVIGKRNDKTVYKLLQRRYG